MLNFIRCRFPVAALMQFGVRLRNSAVVWSWAFHGLRLAAGLLLLPLLLRKLPTADLGMYFIFLSMTSLVPMIDFGFSGTIGRFVSYAMAGATTLQPKGMVPAPRKDADPNRALLWKLLDACRVLYRVLALLAVLILGVGGTFLVASKVGESPSAAHVWWAWGITVLAIAFDLYTTWWNFFLHSMNRVTQSARIGFFAYAVRLAVACGLLMLGAGLLSVPVATLVGTTLGRAWSRRVCLRVLGGPTGDGEKFAWPELVRLLWPNSWRVGLQLLTIHIRTPVSTAICAVAFGLAVTAEYGLSLQIMTICAGLASVWTIVKWPTVGQYRTRQDYPGLQRLLWPRIWLQSLTFLALACGVIVTVPFLLRWFAPEKSVVPTPWFILIALNSFLEMKFIFWTTLLSTENRIPSLWPTVATNAFSLLLLLALLRWTQLGLGALILAPLLAGALFNYWYWPLAGARSIRTSWLRFVFTRPA